MPGYKIVLRVIAVLLVVGVVGFFIYYFAVGGFASAEAYKSYRKIEASTEKTYFDQKTNDDEFMNLLNFYDADNSKFNGYFQCYLAEELVFFEVGDSLYFSPKKAKNKKKLEKKIAKYYDELKNCVGKIKVFETALSEYSSENSDAGTAFSTWEESKLRELSPVVTEAMKNLAIKACDVNSLCFNYARDVCLGGSTYGSLKYTMLDAIKEQARVLCEAFDDQNTSLTSFNALATHTQKARNSYLTQKASDFAQGIVEPSDYYNFRSNYYSVTDADKNEFFKSPDKVSFANSKSGDLKTYLEQINRVMGWSE